MDRIFEEGIKRADAMLVVLSKTAVTRAWVRKELNVGVVRRIEGQIALIPVIIEDCKVPTSLLDTRHIKIKDLNSYEAELDQIVGTLYRRRVKPPLGEAPPYATAEVYSEGDLSQGDIVVWKTACELTIETDKPLLTKEVARRVEPMGLNEDMVRESLEVLERAGYVTGHVGATWFSFTVTRHGRDRYFRVYVPDLAGLRKRIIASLVNETWQGTLAAAEELDLPPIIVNHILGELGAQGYINVTFSRAGTSFLMGPAAASLRRLLED